MGKIHILKNADEKTLKKVVSDIKIDSETVDKIINNNTRIEFNENDDYIFIIFYLPEYVKATKTIDSLEVNILYHLKTNDAFIFTNNSYYFFDKYKSKIDEIDHKGFGSFIERFISVVIDDESKMVEHILSDTNEIRKNYFVGVDNYKLIKDLTSSQINISTLTLITSNQNKLLNLIESYTTTKQQTTLNYKKTYLTEELQYAKEFCTTVMKSIDTKYQVKSAEDLHRFTKFSFVVFIATYFVGLITLLYTDNSRGNIFFFGAIATSVLSLLGVLIFFRSKN